MYTFLFHVDHVHGAQDRGVLRTQFGARLGPCGALWGYVGLSGFPCISQGQSGFGVVERLHAESKMS